MAISYVAGDNNGNWNGGTILNGSSSQNNYGFYIGVRETYVGSGSENYSNIAIQIGIKNNGTRFNTNGWCFKYTVDGQVLDYQTGVNIATNYAGYYDDVRPITIDGSNNRGMYVYSIPHNDDGTKTVRIKVEMYNSSYGSYSPGYCVVDQDFTLTTIARYTKITTFTVSKRDESSLKFNWAAENTVDYVWYSINNGQSWGGVDVTDGTSGSFNVTGLNAGETYTCRLCVRRKDSGLQTYSDNYVQQQVYYYPHVKAVGSSDLTIGNQQTLTIYNPLGRSITVRMYQNNTSGTQLYSGTSSTASESVSYKFTPTANTLYASIPNSQSGNCIYTVIYGSVVNSTGTKTYKVKGTEKPTVTTTAIDTGKTLSNSNTPTNTTIDLTGDNTKFIKFVSDVQVSVSATGNNSATIKSDGYSTKYGNQAAIAGTPHTYNTVESSSFTGYATDSRNLVGNSTATVSTMVDYILLTLEQIELYRDEQTSNTLKCRGNGNYFSGNFGSQNNSLVFKLRYKESSASSWSSWSTKTMTIGTNTYSFDFQVGTTFDYTKTYNFQFEIADKCMTITDSEVAKPGIPVQGLFEDFIENFGIVTFSKGTNELVINGDIKVSGSNKYLKNL